MTSPKPHELGRRRPDWSALAPEGREGLLCAQTVLVWSAWARARLQPDVAWMLAATVIGIWLRSVRYFIDPVSLWLDEAEWGVRLLTEPLVDQAIRPIGFLWLARASCELFGASEAALRLPSYLAGVAVVPIAFLVARSLSDAILVRVLAAFAFALHPLLIDFSKEFKPYSLELTIHLTLLWTTLRALERPVGSVLVTALLAPLVAFPFAYNVVFAFPGISISLGLRVFLERRPRALLGVVSCGAVAIALVALLQWTLHRQPDGAAYGPEYWGRKYDVFLLEDRTTFLGRQPTAAVEWFAFKIADVLMGPAFSPIDWRTTAGGEFEGLVAVLRHAWLPAYLLGAVILVRRGAVRSLVWLAPLVGVVAANLLGKWPLGFFRVNLFSLAYTTLVGLLALESFPRSSGSRLATSLSALVLLVPRLTISAPKPTIKQSWPWMAHSELRRALDVLGARKGTSRLPLVADYYSFQSLPYYERWHPVRADLKRFRRFRAMTVNDVRVLLDEQKAREVWVLVSRLAFVSPVDDLLVRTCLRVERFDLGGHHLLARCELAPIRSKSLTR